MKWPTMRGDTRPAKAVTVQRRERVSAPARLLHYGNLLGIFLKIGSDGIPSGQQIGPRGRGGEEPPRQTVIKPQGSRRQPEVPKFPTGQLTSLRDFGSPHERGGAAPFRQIVKGLVQPLPSEVYKVRGRRE